MNYPFELQRREASAIRLRRKKAGPFAAGAQERQGSSPDASRDGVDLGRLPLRTVGLALSGGGVRAAMFSLGMIQALAKKGRLRDIDFLSSTSGGGFTGCFLGRLFTRDSIAGLAQTKGDPCARVESILGDNASPQIEWLRDNVSYLVGTGGSDASRNLALGLRDLVTLYLILALLGIALFGLLRVAGDWIAGFVGVPGCSVTLGPVVVTALSSWWWLPVGALGGGVGPCAIAYWLAPKRDTRASFSFFPVAGWIALLAVLGFAAGQLSLFGSLISIGVLLLAVVWLEVARHRLPARLDPSTGETSADPGTVIRNRLTSDLGEALVFLLVCILWTIMDTVARGWTFGRLNPFIAACALLAVVAVIAFLRHLAIFLCTGASKKDGRGQRSSWARCAALGAGIIAFPVAGFLLVLLDGAVHWLFNQRFAWGCAASLAGFVLSLIFGRAFDFLNYSALTEVCAARVSHTFLGASNPARLSADADEQGRDVQLVHPDDDIAFDQYHPEVNGGPLHLIGLCVNETADAFSRPGLRRRKGLPMCVGPCGVSAGRKFHAIWVPAPPSDKISWRMRLRQFLDGANPSRADAKIALRAVPVPGEIFHVFQGKNDWPICVESLRLSKWIAASGAGFEMGGGRPTGLAMFLLLGLVNLRFGYWWDSGLNASDRPGRFPSNLWRRLNGPPAALVKMQSLLLADLLGRFQGFAHRFWNISDGGHFDNTGIYELLRRRVPFVLAVDGSEDASFDFDDMGELVRRARIDFGAEVEFVDPAAVANRLPSWIRGWLADPPRTLGSLEEIGQHNLKHAALAQVTYDSEEEAATWIVLLKASVTGDESLDIVSYQKSSPAFPSGPTNDRLDHEAEWESYRALGEHIGDVILFNDSLKPNSPNFEFMKNTSQADH